MCHLWFLTLMLRLNVSWAKVTGKTLSKTLHKHKNLNNIKKSNNKLTPKKAQGLSCILSSSICQNESITSPVTSPTRRLSCAGVDLRTKIVITISFDFFDGLIWLIPTFNVFKAQP